MKHHKKDGFFFFSLWCLKVKRGNIAFWIFRQQIKKCETKSIFFIIYLNFLNKPLFLGLLADYNRSVWYQYPVGTRMFFYGTQHFHNKAILSIFYGRRIPTMVFVPCRRKKIKIKNSSVRYEPTVPSAQVGSIKLKCQNSSRRRTRRP